MGINVQYCDNGVIITQTLAMKEVHVKHSSLNLTHILIKILESYGVSLVQICSITIDNAANMVSLGNLVNKELQNIDKMNSDKNEHNIIDMECEDDESDGENEDVAHPPCDDVAALDASYYEIYSNLEIDFAASDNITVIRCASHTLNLAVCDFLKEIKDIRSKVKTVVKKLRTPTLLHLLRAEKLRKPVIECVTRCGSTYNMFLSLLQLKSVCEKSSADIADLHISEPEWLTIKSVCSVLEPVYSISIKLQKKILL
ncbi:PREDICTED: uncharacterized protein LOC108365257 [Rhagoletis zephyria]|uniref:uncharacterized protein LOC108365257 n=1 Tax=Rhagoletis zephyria TaxID=28612 RepID=UPI000811A1BB|nr:PREDICTED: uncharacterized protein LOC108365257 [Rhagoletis zephyria]